MLNPFYKYIGERLVSFFEKEANLGKRDRYYLYLPSNDLISTLYEILEGQIVSEPFYYQHEDGLNVYETIALYFNGIKYVIATTNNNTTIDFLVTLRNKMSEQKDEWENTSIIFLCDTLNDSIRGGSRDLTSEGLPLHVSQIVGNLDGMMSESRLTEVEKLVIRHYLKRRESEHRIENSSFLDFEDILTLFNKGKMNKEDFQKLHYFPDSELDNFIQEQNEVPFGASKWNSIQRKIDNRLSDNTLQHEEVERLRSLGNPKDKLEEQFDKGGSKLSGDDWFEVDYASIVDWKEELKSKRAISFESEKSKVVLIGNHENEKLEFWKRPKSNSASGRRNWSLIIFHPQYHEGEQVEVTLPFDRHTQTKYLNSTSKKLAISKGHSIVATINLDNTGATFARVVYKHEDSAIGNYTFSIVIVACEPAFLNSQSESFVVQSATKSKRAIQLTLNNQKLSFGLADIAEFDLKEQEQEIELIEGATIQFGPGLLEENENSIRFSIRTPDFELPIEVKDEKLRTFPIDGHKIWESKKNKQSSFRIDENAKKVVLEHFPYATFEKDRPFFLMEMEWIKKRVKKATISLDKLVAEEIVLPDKVEETYNSFLDAIEKSGTIPSLLYYDELVKETAINYIESYIEAIDSIRNQQVMTNEERGLFLLGSARKSDTLFMTPFSPLNVVFQLQINEETEGETIDQNILRRLKAVYTLPYLIDDKNNYYKPTTESRLPEWLAYLPREEVTVGETNNYLAKVVEEKLEQFCDHYDYLFALNDSTPLLVNIINIPNDREVLHGIVDWLKRQIKRNNSLTNLRDIEIISYNSNPRSASAFDELNGVGDAEEIGAQLNIDFSMKEYEGEDVLRVIQKVLHYSKRSINQTLQYSHISFYKMKNEEGIVKQLVKQSPSSLNLNGLFTTAVSSKTEEGGYRAGFGIANSNINRSLLTKFSVKMNELVANMTNRGQDPYAKDIAFAMQIDTKNEGYLADLYAKSHWLTLIDPAVDLNYFQEASANLIIVHYSDQYSSSNHYDAITITDKTNQYFSVIKEFLETQRVQVADGEIEDVIRTFNTFNGEWLLRAVQGRSHDKREKMSVVSAIKQALKIFDKKNVMWVPISMEEIVRVTGNVKLSKKDGVFSGKTIGRRGNCSDDILMMGLEEAESGLKIHMYPVEVKIGNNAADVIEKGISQVLALKGRINEQLVGEKTFDAKFLRNFFVRLFINNAIKMKNNSIWPSKSYEIDSEMVDCLLNDEFEIVNTLQADFGSGMVLSYKKVAQIPAKYRKNGVLVIELPEQAGYDSLAKPIDLLENSFNKLLKPEILDTKNSIEDSQVNTTITKDTENQKVLHYGREKKKIEKKVDETQDSLIIKDVEENKEMEKKGLLEKYNNMTTEILPKKNSVRPLIGLDDGKPVYWEFDHNQLSNRHLVIGGRSGQGKTYFIQSLLVDLAKNNQSAVVIDYSSSYTKKQLDPIFIERVGERLKERVVYHEGFPLNPFLLKYKEVAGIVGLERPSEAARRIVDVFSSVYGTSFGSQQKSALYVAVKRGIEMYGEKMKMELLVEILEELEGYSSQVLMSISSRLVQLVDIDPFDYEAENQWENYFSSDGNITIIQLAGYDQDEIKKLMAEFILWDLWYYTQDGVKDKAIPVVLDEAQNLDFSDGSPSAKILREGRKFGWSAWFATQTFNNFSNEELSILDNAGTKVYFSPAESELKAIAGRIGNTDVDRLRTLHKGQCLVIGQFLQENQILSVPRHYIVKVPAMDSDVRKMTFLNR